MDAMEKSHTLESSIVTSLFNARQAVWSEFSATIQDIKQQFDQANRDRNNEYDRLVSDNRSLNDILNQLQHMIEGKEMEIRGLRCQLDSFCAGRPVCARCASTIYPPKKLVKAGGRTRPDVRKRSRHNASLSSAHSDSTLTTTTTINRAYKQQPRSRWTLHATDSKPATKRQCVRSPLGPFPSTQLTATSTLDDDDDFSTSPKSAHRFEAKEKPPPKRQSPTSTKYAFHMTDLSPPSRDYDASLTMRNAVNQMDLLDMETTQLDTTLQDGINDTTIDQSSIEMSSCTQETSKFIFRRPPPPKSRSRQAAVQLLKHRLRLGSAGHTKHQSVKSVTTRHNKKRTSVQLGNRKSRQTSEGNPNSELTLSPDFLQSECSEFQRPRRTTRPVVSVERSQELDSISLVSAKNLPSVGGSPTPVVPMEIPDPPAEATVSSSVASPRRLTVIRRYQPRARSSPALGNDAETQLPSQSANVAAVNVGSPETTNMHPILKSSPSTENKENDLPLEASVPVVDNDNPQHNEIKYVGPVERRKAARRELPGHTCVQCKEYYESMGLNSSDIANRIHRCSRHRARHGPPPSTPKGYWDIDIPNSEPHVENNTVEKKPVVEQSKTGGGGSFRRRRPLNFPKCSDSPTS